jgi:hypothetical protein
MRKRIIGQEGAGASPAGSPWMDIERLAQVEISSEDPAYPIESALQPGAGPGWRAVLPGPQTIRLLFDAPLRVSLIHVAFQEDQHARTQEFALRWSADGGHSYREIRRQQYTFSPSGTTREVEDYAVSLDGLTALEVRITPEIGGGDLRASLAELYIA